MLLTCTDERLQPGVHAAWSSEQWAQSLQMDANFWNSNETDSVFLI